MQLSNHFVSIVKQYTKSKKLSSVKDWFLTVDGMIIPYLLIESNEVLRGASYYTELNTVARKSFEQLAQNYGLFISRLKKMKKFIR